MKPLARAYPQPPSSELLDVYMQEFGFTRRQAIRYAQSEATRAEIYRNEKYQVQVYRYESGLVHLNIRLITGEVIFRDWREFQEIKNQIVGEEIEACELYPAESRKVDTSNKYHLWCLPPGQNFPFGYLERDVRMPDQVKTPGLKQR